MSNLKVSIICACKNRNEPLYTSIHSWLLKDEVHEVIVVDWSSEKPLDNLTKFDSRIKVIRVDGEKYFNMPEPLNLAASVATGDTVMTMATDYFFNPYPEYNFFDIYPIDDNSFVCGFSNEDEFISGTPTFKFLRGILHVKREHFLKVGGYRNNETGHYGYEDDELVERLIKLGLAPKQISQNYTMIHIPHTDKKRLENFKAYEENVSLTEKTREELSEKYSGDTLEYQTEYILSLRHIYVSNQYYKDNPIDVSVPTEWDIDSINDQLYFAKRKDT